MHRAGVTLLAVGRHGEHRRIRDMGVHISEVGAAAEVDTASVMSAIQVRLWTNSGGPRQHTTAHENVDKNSSKDEIANVNFLRRYGTYVLQNTKKENLLRLTN